MDDTSDTASAQCTSSSLFFRSCDVVGGLEFPRDKPRLEESCACFACTDQAFAARDNVTMTAVSFTKGQRWIYSPHPSFSDPSSTPRPHTRTLTLPPPPQSLALRHPESRPWYCCDGRMTKGVGGGGGRRQGRREG